MKKRTQAGFSLYELMVTLTIVGIVLMVGIPNMGAFRQNSRMISTANDLHSSFYLARSEAARAKANITICASADSMDDPPSCGGEFEDGWIIFQDDDGDIVVDAGEAILRRLPARHESLNIDTTGMGDYFSYAATGLGRGQVLALPPVTVAVICDVRGNVTGPGGRSAARVLVITPLGRATVLRDVAQITFHGGCP
ncbi:MAG: GspH/FimT family pseudopilin [Proteobacteria bacterium]|nr:GspH/FimT family pseudopilin [Pseudomonadota bacterium]